MQQFAKCFLLMILISVTPALQQTFNTGTSNVNEEFHEELYVRPMTSGHVNTYFQFTTKWHYGERSNLHNTNLVPRPIAEILLHYDVRELHISLTQGLWRYESWGYPIKDAPPGAEASAWFTGENLTVTQVDEQWTRLASTLSGILCASLNFIDKTNTVEPKYGFRPKYSIGNQNSKDLPKYLRYASLPREIVCTENLTPWKKLLPCHSKEGFSSLLNSGNVHNTNYHSLGISIRTICETLDKNCILEFTEIANLVYDPKLLGISDFSLRRFFGQGLNGYCTLAKSSKIYVNLDNQRYDLTPEPTYKTHSTRGGTTTQLGVYDVQRMVNEGDKLFNIAWVTQQKYKNTVPIIIAPPIYVHRYILGHGQERGKIVTQITNTHYTSLPIILQENIPWFVPAYMHTLKLIVTTTTSQQYEIKPKAINYIPGIQRTRCYHLELAFEIPAKSIVEISFDFDYIFLKWLEYPPDANHGHYLGSAVITTQLPMGRNYSAMPVEGYLFAHSFNASRPVYVLELHTESLILSLPTPDFSMPYNVICLACTVVALAFGPIHSVATKRIIIEQRDATPQTLMGKLMYKIFKKKLKTKTNHDKQTENNTLQDEELNDDLNDINLHEKSD